MTVKTKVENAQKDKRLKKLIDNPKKLEKETFLKTNDKGENFNPSEQQNYPGPRKHQANIGPDKEDD